MGEATRITLLDRVRQTQAGDSWDEFAAVYDALILSWLRQQAISDADADDIRQEVMQTVIQEIANFDHNGRPGAFRNWLRRITANRMRRLWQKRGPRSSDDAGADVGALAAELEDDASRLTHVWDADHDRFVLNRMLALLNGRFSAKSLAAFRRLAIDEEDVDEVSKDLGMTIGAARVAQHRVLRALKELGAGLIDV